MAELKWLRGCGWIEGGIEVADAPPPGPHLVFLRSSLGSFTILRPVWTELIRAVKAGEFDEVGR